MILTKLYSLSPFIVKRINSNFHGMNIKISFSFSPFLAASQHSKQILEKSHFKNFLSVPLKVDMSSTFFNQVFHESIPFSSTGSILTVINCYFSCITLNGDPLINKCANIENSVFAKINSQIPFLHFPNDETPSNISKCYFFSTSPILFSESTSTISYSSFNLKSLSNANEYTFIDQRNINSDYYNNFTSCNELMNPILYVCGNSLDNFKLVSINSSSPLIEGLILSIESSIFFNNRIKGSNLINFHSHLTIVANCKIYKNQYDEGFKFHNSELTVKTENLESDDSSLTNSPSFVEKDFIEINLVENYEYIFFKNISDVLFS